MPAKSDSRTRNLALTVQQPLAELISRGKKKIEYRSRSTRIRERVYIYPSKKPHRTAFKRMRREPGNFPVCVLIGSVEIVDCREGPTDINGCSKIPDV